MRYTHEVNACALGCAAAVITWSLFLRWRQSRQGRRLCPGPRIPRWKWLLPWRWFIRPGCGYDLHGLRPDSAGGITCPECARRLPSISRASLHTRRIRWLPIALIGITAAWGVLHSSYIRSGSWAKDIPNWLVTGHRRVFGHYGLRPLRREFDERLNARSLTREQSISLIPCFVDDLRHDDIIGNADIARAALVNIGQPAIPRLEATLDSSDWQQRTLAAEILRSIHKADWEAYRPSRRLLEVTAESLRSDTPTESDAERHARPRYIYRGSLEDSVNYLTKMGDRVVPLLLRTMHGDNEQARVFAAGIAGLAGLSDLMPEAAPILIDHLKPNNVERDAEFAVAGLFGFGPDVMAYLRPYQESDTAQLRCAARLIELDFIAGPDECEPARAAIARYVSENYDAVRAGSREGYDGWLPDIPANHR